MVAEATSPRRGVLKWANREVFSDYSCFSGSQLPILRGVRISSQRSMAAVVAGSMMLGCMVGCGCVPVCQVIIEESCEECGNCGQAACTPSQPLCARPLVCRGCGWSPGGGPEGGVTEEAAFYVHPRFHPVPTEPTFHRQPVGPPLGVSPGPVIDFSPQSLPEEIHTEEIDTPAPEPATDDSTTSVPRRLDGTEDPASWVFNRSDSEQVRKAQSPAADRRFR